MNASHILLNHFSQRYPKLPKLNLPTNPTSSDGTPSATAQPDISISFDFMSIKVGEMWKMAHYMDPLSMLFDEAEPEDGDDTTGAVEGDINPSVDPPAPVPNAKGGKKQNGGGGGGKGGQKAGSVTTATEPTISKKAQKRAERKAEQKQMDEEKANNEAKAKEEEKERERSPADLPDAKRAKVDTGGHEVLREPVTNAV
jgi:ribonuclease Z